MVPQQSALSAAVIALLLACGVSLSVAAPAARPPVCAGTWYPGQRDELARFVDELLQKTPPADATAAKPVAIIAPHAGYRFSAPVAAAAYARLRGHKYDRVIVLAFSHRRAYSYAGVSVPHDWTAYETPLGDVPIDIATVEKLRRTEPFVAVPGIDREEHSLELQLPLLQRAVGEFRLVPLLVGQMTPQSYAQAAAALHPLMDDNTLIVASSDCTHFGPNYDYEPFQDDVAKRLEELAAKATAPIQLCDFDGFAAHLAATRDTICGRGPIFLLLRTLSMGGGADGLRTGFDTSGRQTGDYTNSVTYQSFVFTRPRGTLDEPARAALLKLARETVTACLHHHDLPKPAASDLPPAVRADGACFVTLQNHGELRGCIGNLQAAGPLYEAVIDNAVQACQDARFVSNPVTAKELDQLHIEISYLTPFKPVARIEDIIIGRHGLLIGLNNRRGVLLPQVAYERGWTRDVFLAQVCQKAGLPPDAWKNPQAKLHSFQAEVFGEPQPTSRPATREE